MKNLIIPLVFCVFLFFSFSCKKENTVKPNLTLDSIEIVTDTMAIDFKCLIFQGETDTSYSQEYLIKSESAYDSLIRNKCRRYILPNIDFTKYMLAGYKIWNGDDSTVIIKQVKKDNINKILNYHIDVYSTHYRWNCDFPVFKSMNWILIPQVSNEWTLRIDTNVIFIK